MGQYDRKKEIEQRIIQSPVAGGGNVAAVLRRLREAWDLGVGEFQAVAYALFGIELADASASDQQRAVIGDIIGTQSGPGSVQDWEEKVREARDALGVATAQAQATGAIPGGLSIDGRKSSFDWLSSQGFIVALGGVIILIAILLYMENG